MIAQLKGINFADPADGPVDSAWVEMWVGPAAGQGEERFDILVCTPSWLESEVEREGKKFGWALLVLPRVDMSIIEPIVRERISTFDGPDWHSIARRIAQFAIWEFQD